MLFAALAPALFVLPGQAGEETGLDPTLKVNTVKKRTHSLFTQGGSYGMLPTRRPERLKALVQRFSELLAAKPALSLVETPK